MADELNEDLAAAKRLRDYAGSWDDQAAEVDEESRATVPDLLRAAEALEERAAAHDLGAGDTDADRAEAGAHPS